MYFVKLIVISHQSLIALLLKYPKLTNNITVTVNNLIDTIKYTKIKILVPSTFNIKNK